MVEPLQLVQQVVLRQVALLVIVDDGVQVREVAVQVHAVVVGPPDQVVPPALGCGF